MNSVGRNPTEQQFGAASLYASLLEEMKLRIFSVRDAASGLVSLHPILLNDFCYLQLRMLCELIALGCLTAHGDIKEVQMPGLQKESAPGKIIKQLERLHPNFYPHPVTLDVKPANAQSPGSVHMDRKASGFLTKRELVKLWEVCGNNLHRGTLKKIKSHVGEGISQDISDIVIWINKIICLLDQHHIASFDNLSHFICVLQATDRNNQSIVAVALSPLPKES